MTAASASEAAAPGTPVTPGVVPDGAPLALARPHRPVAPRSEPREARRRSVPLDHVALLSAVRETTDAYHQAEAALHAARVARQRAIIAARAAGIPLTQVAEYACRAGSPPLSHRQVSRLEEATITEPKEHTP